MNQYKHPILSTISETPGYLAGWEQLGATEI